MLPRTSRLRHVLSGVALVFCGVILACGAGEGLVRLATADQQNYLIEMWRYATLLKRESPDPAVGHEHIPGKSARLQGVVVAINSLGMRGPEPDLKTPGRQHVVIMGDSIAMGWGVPEKDSLRGQLAARLGPKAEVMTTGVGNMNMRQIIAHGLHYTARIRPQTVILLATARAPAIQPEDHAGWLVRHSELYALIVSMVEMATEKTPGENGLVDAYRKVWTGGPGRAEMDGALDRLKADQQKYGYRVLVVMIPEPHSFTPYRFGFIEKIMKQEATEHGWTFIDPEPEMQKRPAKDYWVAGDDVHPNKAAFRILTNLLMPYLRQTNG